MRPPILKQRGIPPSHLLAPTGAADFLRGHDAMAALLPTVKRLIALQTDCSKTLPAMFQTCKVLQLDAGQLILSTPNAALAARLKQQLPNLQNTLLESGWQINTIRIKIQMAPNLAKPIASKNLTLPSLAITAFSALDEALETSPRNAALKAAIKAIAARR